MPQRGQLEFHGKLDGLFKASMEKFSVAFAKIAEHPKVRAAHLGDVHEGDVFMAAPLYFAGAEYTTAVGIDKN